MSSQSTREQQCKQRSVAYAFEALAIRCSPERLRLFRSQPVPEAYAQLSHAFNAADTGCQVGTKKTTIGCFTGETAHRTEAEVNRPRSELSGLQMRAIAQDDRSVQRQSGFRTIPVDELVDRVSIASLGFWAGETVQNRGFCIVEIGQAQDGLCCGALGP